MTLFKKITTLAKEFPPLPNIVFVCDAMDGRRKVEDAVAKLDSTPNYYPLGKMPDRLLEIPLFERSWVPRGEIWKMPIEYLDALDSILGRYEMTASEALALVEKES